MLLFVFACAPHDPNVRELREIWSATRDDALLLDYLRALPAEERDSDSLRRFAARTFREDPEKLWLAEQVLAYGPEPLWPGEILEQRHTKIPPGGFVRATLLQTEEGRAVEALLVQGYTPRRALVIAGVHGSERSGIEAVERLAQRLQAEIPAETTVLLPVVFPDNAAQRLREIPEIPTNRNFPPPGSPPGSPPLDALGRPIWPENLALLDLIDRFRPERIASVHATVRPNASGVFSDPHSSPPGSGPEEIREAARLTEADARLAVAVASEIAKTHPASVLGNDLLGLAHAGWSGGVDGGTSLGGWGPSPIRGFGPLDRPSIGVLTVELPELHRSDDLSGEEAMQRAEEVQAFADALYEVFLGGDGAG